MMNKEIERLKKKYKSWAPDIQRTYEYVNDATDDVYVSEIVNHLNIKWTRALALLGMMDDAGLVTAKYEVYTPDREFVTAVYREEDVPNPETSLIRMVFEKGAK